MTPKTFFLIIIWSLLLATGTANADVPPSEGSVIWHTYLGGDYFIDNVHDHAKGIALDAHGDVYIVGYSVTQWDTDVIPVYPHTPLLDPMLTGQHPRHKDVFVAKLSGNAVRDSQGTVVVDEGDLIWHTFLGSPATSTDYGEDEGLGIVVDSNCIAEAQAGEQVDSYGCVYVTGWSNATWGVPINAFWPGAANDSDAFLAKLDAVSGALEWNTFFGSYPRGGWLAKDYGHDLALDSDGFVYVTGHSMWSWGDPQLPRRDHTSGGAYTDDVFVAKFDKSGHFLWNTFLGGDKLDIGNGISLDAAGNIFVTGWSSLYYTSGTWSDTTAEQLKDPAASLCPPSLCLSDDAFVARLKTDGELEWYGFYGGTWRDWSNDVDVDQSGHLYIVGDSDAPWGNDSNWTDLSDAFAAKIDAEDGHLYWNTFMGGPMAQFGYAITVDSSGRVSVTGSGLISYNGGGDLFVAALDNDGNQLWTPPLTVPFEGNGGYEEGFGIASSDDGYLFVAGYGEHESGEPLNHHSDYSSGLLTGDDALVAKVYAGQTETDADGDGVPDDQDICPGGDDNVDTDSDLVPNFCDNCPLDYFNDSDGDGSCDSDDLCLGDDASGDSDADGLCDDSDPCTGISNSDADGDGVCDEGDLCIGDDATGNSDGDAVCNDLDACEGDDAAGDTDDDLFCDDLDACPEDFFNDSDNDGFCGDVDNCPLIENFNQLNTDGDDEGDECDSDDDNDTFGDEEDNCPLVANDQADFDGDGAGDECDSDEDGDGVDDDEDACLLSPIGNPVDADGCGIAELCLCDNNWKNHGAYVRCVAHTSEDFVAAGLITEVEKDAIVSTAGMSGCGAKK